MESNISIGSSTDNDIILSVQTESNLIHMPIPNFSVFGLASDLHELNLPSCRDVLKYFFFLSDRAKNENKMFSYTSFISQVADKLIEIWSKLNIAIMTKKFVISKLKSFLNKYSQATKAKSTTEKYNAFVEAMNTLFYIGKCKCTLQSNRCSCGLTPDHLHEFLTDQLSVRKLTIPEVLTDVVDLESDAIATEDSSYRPETSYMEVDEDFIFRTPNLENAIVLNRGPYTRRFDTPNYAMMCDRFGVSDRVAACLATALFKDIGFKDENGEVIIMDKCKVAREKKKNRDSVREKQTIASSLLAFAFDGRKDESLKMENISNKLHPRMVKESHIVVVREPKTELLGHLILDAEDAGTKQMQLYDFFVEKNLALTNLVGICCDGEVTNTGTGTGILRRFEVMLDKPLHWFVCLLHFNELPFRHLFASLEKSNTSGPRTDTGALTKLMETCEQIQVVSDFVSISLGNMPPALSAEQEKKLSTDVKYLYQIAFAIHNGSCPEGLGHIKPGPIVHSRWLTKAGRLLRLYVTTNSPSENLKILATYVMKVYVPMYFNVKYYDSVIHGSALLYKFICSTQYLPQNLREIVNNVVQNNGYFAHSENVLLTMIFDNRKEVRGMALKIILHYRENIYDPTKLRVYKKPTINFNCTKYFDMINLDDDGILSEPPFTASIPYEHLLNYIEFDDPPLPDPHIPLHIQGTAVCATTD